MKIIDVIGALETIVVEYCAGQNVSFNMEAYNRDSIEGKSKRLGALVTAAMKASYSERETLYNYVLYIISSLHSLHEINESTKKFVLKPSLTKEEVLKAQNDFEDFLWNIITLLKTSQTALIEISYNHQKIKMPGLLRRGNIYSSYCYTGELFCNPKKLFALLILDDKSSKERCKEEADNCFAPLLIHVLELQIQDLEKKLAATLRASEEEEKLRSQVERLVREKDIAIEELKKSEELARHRLEQSQKAQDNLLAENVELKQENADKTKTIAAKDLELAAKDKQLEAKDQLVAEKEQQLALMQKRIAALEQSNRSKDEACEKIQTELSAVRAFGAPFSLTAQLYGTNRHILMRNLNPKPEEEKQTLTAKDSDEFPGLGVFKGSLVD
ncbi:hypothetical protein Lqui_1209 [Legionella quinlivanii]|uniref:Uncharacterized protein n=1 Tax=Legionella quinlivanii TaxID=45073 RepID=A0A0W0Y276_9GAMM|nr:hypothetical protein [Legionella quinlivanii]KTD50643.1 hypothetical protein Lqui_1209 [Legionella quinlivanii]SEG35325.1 hypothetical protein SAMN02746093_02624 [Legionella quinlivanii DSM 21216]STY11584.1 Uncharacterised protein [Legionella quinlivanii]